MKKGLRILFSFIIMFSLTLSSTSMTMANEDLRKQEDIKKIVDNINKINEEFGSATRCSMKSIA